MKNTLLSLFLIIFLTGWYTSPGQTTQFEDEIQWEGLVEEKVAYGQYHQYLYFTGASIDPGSNLPLYVHDLQVNNTRVVIEPVLETAQYVPCNSDEINFLSESGFNRTKIEFNTFISTQDKQSTGHVSFIPIRINPASGTYEKMVGFTVSVTQKHDSSEMQKSTVADYAENSVLSSGEWYKFKTTESGIYKIGFDDLVEAGLDPTGIDPRYLSLYGNGGGMVPEKNSKPRPDDLVENAIYVSGEQDGIFDPDDHILFYGMSPHTWYEQLRFFYYEINHYDNHNYYYLTLSDEPGKRIDTEPYPSYPPNLTINSYNHYKVIEDEKTNLISSGKAWYGDEFSNVKQRSYTFEFPNILQNAQATVKIGVANRTFINDSLVVKFNGTVMDTMTLTSVQANKTKYAQKKKKTFEYTLQEPVLTVDLEYRQAEASSKMWLDYIYVNTRSKLKLIDGQLLFRDLTNLNEGAVTKFLFEEAAESTQFWDVTDCTNPLHIESQFVNNDVDIVVPTGNLREFIAFDGSNFLEPEFVEKVENQDLHGSGPYEYIIVTHPLFREHAERLAALHDSTSNLNGILVVEPDVIYNEFSSGKQDPTAIRDMIRMFYQKFPGNEPKYLLLFGDGSFDPKDRIEHNTNLIPTYQTDESWTTSSSYVVDDYFGLLDDEEGEDAYGTVDIGIGRLPVATIEHADVVLNKIESYIRGTGNMLEDWKNTLCIIADDEDNNLHIKQADSLSSGYDYIPGYVNQRKIYLDAFPQVSTPSGKRYPQVKEQINEQVNEGALIINYIGHGGSGGWAEERIVQIHDILSWNNQVKFPVFITATCEFSRFDEPEIISAGEWVLLNGQGGGVALLTTTRLAYSLSNFRLNERIYARMFVENNGEMPNLGDIIKYSKPPGQLTTRNFVLLGDPALKIDYPNHRVNTTKVMVNGEEIGQDNQVDTIQSLQLVTLEGEIVDYEGQRVEDFNGEVFPVLFDKPKQSTTLGNDLGSSPFNFEQQTQVLWEGKSSVENGVFSTSFVVPVDMSQRMEKGKVSFYARSETEDATGVFNDFILWGIDENAATDNTGPQIDLYINDTTFVSGDQTHDDPVLLAFLSDEHGINLSTNGIGHNITAVLDEDYSNIMLMDDYFELDMNDYKKGKITFPFHDLGNGMHTLTLKAWDSYTNSNEATIKFYINKEAGLNLSEVKNYPNPFRDETVFSFRHTKPGTQINVKLEIYNLFGKFILSYETDLFSEGTELDFLTWDGRDVNGNRLGSGIYVYNITITDEDGHVTKQKQKLIIQ